MFLGSKDASYWQELLQPLFGGQRGTWKHRLAERILRSRLFLCPGYARLGPFYGMPTAWGPRSSTLAATATIGGVYGIALRYRNFLGFGWPWADNDAEPASHSRERDCETEPNDCPHRRTIGPGRRRDNVRLVGLFRAMKVFQDFCIGDR